MQGPRAIEAAHCDHAFQRSEADVCYIIRVAADLVYHLPVLKVINLRHRPIFRFLSEGKYSNLIAFWRKLCHFDSLIDAN